MINFLFSKRPTNEFNLTIHKRHIGSNTGEDAILHNTHTAHRQGAPFVFRNGLQINSK